MTTSHTDSDSPSTIPQSPTREAAECEAGLRRVLAYICARRHRRLLAFTAVFLLIYAITRIPVSFVASIAFGLFIGFILSEDISIGPEMYPLIQSLLSIIPSLVFTLLIFGRLRKTYLSYISPDDS